MYAYRYRRRRRYRRGLSGPQIAAAAAAGLALAFIARHSAVGRHPVGSHHAATRAAAGAGAAQAAQPSTAASNVALGQKMAAAYGWGTGAQWSCLDALWTRESGWSATAANPVSDARGIAQDINGWSASYQYGNAGQQIAWGLAYIRGRYGTPCAAWNHETSAGWY